MAAVVVKTKKGGYHVKKSGVGTHGDRRMKRRKTRGSRKREALKRGW